MNVTVSSGRVRRRHAAAPSHLDLRGALHELFANTHTYFVWAVGDRAAAHLLLARKRGSDRSRQFECPAEVAVTAGDRNDRTGRVDTRTGDEALVDSALKAEGRAAQIAHGRETAQQGITGFVTRDQVRVADVPRERLRGRRPHQHGVPVHVDQTRHERATATINEDGADAAIGWYRRGGDSLDAVAAHEHERRRGELARPCHRTRARSEKA